MKVVLERDAFPPERAHSIDAGIDFRAPRAQVIGPHGWGAVDTKVHVQIPHGYAGLIVSKSGLNLRKGVTCTGLIDEGYTGAVVAIVHNDSEDFHLIKRGDKVMQMVVIPVSYTDIEIADRLDEDTERGSDGFGSTGR